MTDLPSRVFITEEGPREGFQIEKGPITTERKIELIDALSQTGVGHIVTVSFVNPKVVPQMADAEAVVEGFEAAPGVTYSATVLNARGVERALASKKLTVPGMITAVASAAFLARNQNSTPEAQVEEQIKKIRLYREHNVPVDAGGLGAAFGCNFQGECPSPLSSSLRETCWKSPGARA